MEQAYERELRRAILGSEQKRVFIVAGVLAAALGVFLTVTGVRPDLLDALFHGEVRRPYVALILAACAAFELAVGVAIGRRRAADGDLAGWLRYAHTFLELSAVSAVFVFLFRVFPPAVALTMPTSFGYFVIIILSTLRLDPPLSGFAGAVASAQYVTLAAHAIGAPLPPGYDPILIAWPQHAGKAVVLFLAGIIAGLVAGELRRQISGVFRSREERQRVVDVFGRHVSHAVVNKLLEQPTELASEVRHVCVMFLDIRNFTTFSEHRTPSEVVAFLNQLFGFMIEEVNRHHGIVNKFLGDGFMAVFGAPISDGRDSRNAVDAARAILARLDELVASGGLPPTRVGIGLHSGEAVTGTVGSAERKEYTVIGDVVNLASRIESLNKELGAQLLCSKRVFDDLPAGSIPGTPRGPMKVKGRAEPVEIIQLA